jgi:arylformamidase
MVAFVANTGTYVESPFHRFAQGMDLSELPLASLANLPGNIVTALDRGKCISADIFQGLKLAGIVVLVHSRWARHWDSQ